MINKNETIDYLYASALLMKLFKAQIISYKVFEIADGKCRERLCG